MMEAARFNGRIGVIGAGALGGLYGARIGRAGYDVAFLMRSDFEAVKERGLEIRSFQGDFTIRPPVFRTAEEMGPCDLVIVGLKSCDNGALEGLLGGVCRADTVVLTLQNGLGNEEAIAKVLGGLFPGSSPEERILGGVAFLCSNRLGPGVIHHLEYGRVRLAEFAGAARTRTHSVARLFTDAGFECEVSDSLVGIRWEKLVWNIPFNGLGVGGVRADTAVVLGDDALRKTAVALMEEVRRAARADGVEIPESFADYMMHLTTSMGPYKSSMQIDFETGRPLELEAILGEPLRRAEAAGIDTPLLRMLYGVVGRMDGARRDG